MESLDVRELLLANDVIEITDTETCNTRWFFFRRRTEESQNEEKHKISQRINRNEKEQSQRILENAEIIEKTGKVGEKTFFDNKLIQRRRDNSWSCVKGNYTSLIYSYV